MYVLKGGMLGSWAMGRAAAEAALPQAGGSGRKAKSDPAKIQLLRNRHRLSVPGCPLFTPPSLPIIIFTSTPTLRPADG